MTTNTHDIDYILRRGVAEIIVEKELRQRLASGEPQRLKMGFDPSRPDLHLGYAVALRKLRQLQDIGHQVILIVGDWTARIGDPTGRSETRVMLTEEQVNANAESYMRQFFKIVDEDKTQVVRQSEWFGNFTLDKVIDLTSRFTVAQMLAREDFAKRYEARQPIAITEFLYPLLQGYDSVAIRSDVEFGGMDQKFNCLVGRDLQEQSGQRPQQVFLLPLLLGTDGRKMSQSYGNYIAFEAPPSDMYGKIMSIPDNVMLAYMELLTDVPDEEIAVYGEEIEGNRINPIDVKHRLAREIVEQFHSIEDAAGAEAEFRRVVQGGAMPDEIDELSLASFANETQGVIERQRFVMSGEKASLRYLVDMRAFLAAAKLASSKSEAQRLMRGRALEVDGVRFDPGPVDSFQFELKAGSTLKLGKRRYLKLVD